MPGVTGTSRMISVLVEDRPAVLQRITNCLGRRGFQLQSCSIGQAATDGCLRVTLRVDVGGQPPDQVVKQLRRLVDVVEVIDLTATTPVEWETTLIKLGHDGDPSAIVREITTCRGQVVDASATTITAALSGDPLLVDAGLARLNSFQILDLARSGPVAVARHGAGQGG